MANPLSNLANNYSIYVWNKRETCLIEYKDCDCFLEYTCLEDDLIEYKCLCFNKNFTNLQIS